MPKVILTCGPDFRLDLYRTAMQHLAEALPAIVADALTCDDPDGTLVANDIEVEVRQCESLIINPSDIAIDIFANDFPERKANLKERHGQIYSGVLNMMIGFSEKPFAFPSSTVCVGIWVLLAPASYGLFLLNPGE